MVKEIFIKVEKIKKPSVQIYGTDGSQKFLERISFSEQAAE